MPPSTLKADIGVTVANHERLTDRGAWASFQPRLHIENLGLFSDQVPLELDYVPALRGHMMREGYLQATDIDWQVDLPLMAETVRALSAAGLSPVFAFVYDEFWLPFRKLAGVYRNLLGDYAMLPDFWVWNVDPQRGEAGWGPHRDKGAISLLPDGTPKSVTTWIPLTAATPLNSCMYIVPAMDDRTYGTANENTHSFDLQSVRALPAQPGDVLIWNQAVLHWGSKTSARSAENRVSMAVEFQRRDQPPLNQPLINPLAMVPFDVRLKLIAKQILQYRHMYRVAPAVEKFALDLMK